MKSTFDDSPYFRSHGKAPRGTGGWGFADINDQNDIDKVRFFYGTFSQARSQANKAFPAGSIIVVMP